MYLSQAASLLVSTLFGLLSALLLVRLLLQWVGADPYNPISLFLRRLFQPVLRPLAVALPNLGRFNTAALALLLLLQGLKWMLLGWLQGAALGLAALLLLALHGTLDLALTVLLWLVIFAVILSFLAPFGEHPLIPLLRDLTEPLLAPFRRLLPTVGPLDFSPILAILAIELARLLLARPLYDLALGG